MERVRRPGAHLGIGGCLKLPARYPERWTPIRRRRFDGKRSHRLPPRASTRAPESHHDPESDRRAGGLRSSSYHFPLRNSRLVIRGGERTRRPARALVGRVWCSHRAATGRIHRQAPGNGITSSCSTPSQTVAFVLVRVCPCHHAVCHCDTTNSHRSGPRRCACDVAGNQLVLALNSTRLGRNIQRGGTLLHFRSRFRESGRKSVLRQLP
jgi:hypothetical protein